MNTRNRHITPATNHDGGNHRSINFDRKTARLPLAKSAGLVLLCLLVASRVHGETLLERGSYLVNAVMACDNCHTPRGPDGFAMDRRFSGGSQIWDEPGYSVRGANITQDRATGIGSWSDEEIKRALTEGIRPDGELLAPIMPSSFYRILTSRDLNAVVAYLRTIKPVQNAVEAPVYKTKMHIPAVPGAEQSLPDSAMQNSVQRGRYIATVAHCMECHARRPDGQHDYRDWLGRGGARNERPIWESDRGEYHLSPGIRYRCVE